MPANYFEEGRLPGICVVTGAPATSNLRRRFNTTPNWVGCLFFINWFALFVAIVATRRRASGDLPVCNAVAVRVRRRHAVAVRLLVVAVVLLIAIAPVAGSPVGAALGGAGLLALLGYVVASMMEGAALPIQGRVVEDGFGGRWVQLRGVHPAFSRALATRLGR